MINRLFIENVEIARVLQFQYNNKNSLIIKTALDGTVYAQTTGKSYKLASVEIFCPSMYSRLMVETAASNCTKIKISYHNVNYYGYIDGDISFEWFKNGESSTAKLNLRVDE